jgi:PAS domain S-box-containing protein
MSHIPTYDELEQRIRELENADLERRQAEKALMESERKWRNILINTPQIGITLDTRARIIFANDFFLSLTRWSREEVIGRDWFDMFIPDSERDEVREVFDSVMSGKEPFGLSSYENQIIIKSGELRTIAWSNVITKDTYGNIVDATCLGVDLTERKRAEEALRENEKKHRSLFEQSADAVYITSREGTFLDANTALLALFGYTKRELLSALNVRQLYRNPEDRDAFQEKIEATGFVRNYPIKFKKKDGSEIDCLLTSSVRRSEDGAVQGYQGIIRDVTEQKAAEKALRDSEAHYRAMVEAFDGLIYICSRDYRVKFMNRRFLERTGRDATGEFCYKAVHNLDHVCPWCVNDRVFKGETVRWEVRSPRDNRWYYVVNTPIFHTDGTMSKQALILDITERKKMEQELKDSAEKLKVFAYSVSHDLKGPAIGAYGFAKRLLEKYRDSLDETAAHYCDQIAAASEQIVALVDQINIFIAAKEVPLNLETVEVGEILTRIREDFSPQFQVRQIEWIEPERIPPIIADRLSVFRILRNLVDNALKYGGTELSRIRIGYCDDQYHHLLFAEDDGAGIGREDAEKIFGVFMRRKDSKGVQGAGMGLAIVKELAERHGGEAWVKPGAERGSIFYISIRKDLSRGRDVDPSG